MYINLPSSDVLASEDFPLLPLSPVSYMFGAVSSDLNHFSTPFCKSREHRCVSVLLASVAFMIRSTRSYD